MPPQRGLIIGVACLPAEGEELLDVFNPNVVVSSVKPTSDGDALQVYGHGAGRPLA